LTPPLRPEPFEHLEARFAKAIQPRFDCERVAAMQAIGRHNHWQPWLDRRHLFDWPDGLRLIAYVDWFASTNISVLHVIAVCDAETFVRLAGGRVVGTEVAGDMDGRRYGVLVRKRVAMLTGRSDLVCKAQTTAEADIGHLSIHLFAPLTPADASAFAAYEAARTFGGGR
jgi:hypothetical protein